MFGTSLAPAHECALFPTMVFHTWGCWWCVLFDDVALMSSACIITGFMHTIKAGVTVVCSDLGFGLECGSRNTINSGFRSRYHHTPPLGSPSPWRPVTCTLWVSVLFYVVCHLRPVCIQVGLSYCYFNLCWDRRHCNSRAGERTIPFG